MKRVKIQRLWNDRNQTLGVFTVLDQKGQPIFACLCLERGNRNNQKNVSSVPEGRYPLVLEHSAKFNQNLYELKDVPNRTECKIHPLNFWTQLNGCIALGLKLKDMNNDGYSDITNSKATVELFHKVMKNTPRTTIEIINPL